MGLRVNTLYLWPTLLVLLLLKIEDADLEPITRRNRHQRYPLQNPESVQADLPAEAVPHLLGEEAASNVPAKRQGEALNVCILTADFWGLKAAGGTATAYHLLAAVLAKEESLNVTFLQTTKRYRVCQEAKELNKLPGLTFACLSKRHFSPEVAESLPYSAVSQAIVAWMAEQPGRCDIVHAHEWGGVFADLVTMNHFRRLQPGLRIAIEPHGGHVWSQLGEVNRPMDVYALRIDSSERATNALNDIEISPTKYMLSYLRQRGWALPDSTLVIPNIVPDAEKHALEPTGAKKVWRIAFFGRLEERKGIKLFVEAVNKLQDDYDIMDLEAFEIYIVGPDAIVDMVPSKQWLKSQTADWKVKTFLKINVPRDEALDIISQEGMLLVLCSFIDNMPYVVAEAAIKGIPFLAFDAGGVLELFDHEEHAGNVIKHATPAALASRLNEVLTHGSLSTVKLAKEVTTGQQKWLKFHADFAHETAEYKEEDLQLLARARARTNPARIVDVKRVQSSLDLWEPLCVKEDAEADEVLVLLPEGYVLPKKQKALLEISELLSIADARSSPIRALTFGIDMPNKKAAFPSAPTWMVYAGDHQHCMDDIPVAITKKSFCDAFLGQARVFQFYNAWILALLLDHTDGMMHTYPRVLFRATEYTAAGTSNCAIDKIPQKRAKDYTTAASRLFRDAAAMMHGMVLAHAQKPLVSLLDDASTGQLHKGWEYGYLDGFANQTRRIKPLVWEPAEENEFGEGIWGCGPQRDESIINYPHFKRQLLHPCHHEDGKCCNSTVHAPFLLRLNSFIYADRAAVQISYDAYPVCGDGFDFRVTHFQAESDKPNVIIDAAYDPVSKTSRPRRQTIEVLIDIRPGDQIDFVVDPRHNHDCDGLYIIEAKIWPPTEDKVKKKVVQKQT